LGENRRFHQHSAVLVAIQQGGNAMIAIAISILWLLVGIIVLCGAVYLVLYGLKNILGIQIPPRLEQGVWFIVLLLIIIAVLSLIASGGTTVPFRLH